MREILFRGKRIDNGEWVQGTPFFGGNNSCKMIFACALHPDFVDEGNVYYSEGFPVDPATVGQYTGLTDKNGAKIFEGDRVRVPMFRIYNQVPERGTVEFRSAAFSVKWDDENYGRNFAGYLDDMEVIGNIHDNPKLLEG